MIKSIYKTKVINNKIFLFAAVILFFFTACRKETTIHGVVYDYYTLKPIKESLEVELLGGYFNIDIDKVNTNENGEFFFETRRNVSRVRTTNEYCTPGTYDSSNFAYVNTGESNEVKLYVGQKAQFFITIKNTNPYDKYDFIEITGKNGMGGDYFSRYGNNLDTSFSMDGIANTTNIFDYNVIKNGTKTTSRIYFFVNLDNTSTAQINY